MDISARHFKDANPNDTIVRLKSILKEHAIETEEIWSEKSYIDTYSLRVVFKGTSIGTNGKGVSKEYALASAYGELFERYQNNLFKAKFKPFKEELNFYENADEKLLSSEEIIKNNDSVTNFYFKCQHLNFSTEEKIKNFQEYIKTDFIDYELENKYVTLPFYNINENSIEYIPKSLYRRFYGSNGMCAGNSREEALTQGVAEIIERHVQYKIFTESPVLPDIPEDYIAKYPYVFDMYKKLKDLNPNEYSFYLKDCSFGGKYPAAAVIIVEKNTGYYGLKIGCHPDYGIAMERAFTEATQGNDIFVYANRSKINFNNKNVLNPINIYNSYKVGSGIYPYQIFGSAPTYNFTPVKDVSNLSNAAILKNWIHELNKEGYKILIRDESCFGFYTYQIIIPGLSEMWPFSKFPESFSIYFRAYNTKYYVARLLTDFNKINEKNIDYIISSIEFFKGFILENSIDTYSAIKKGWYFQEAFSEMEFLESICQVIKKEYKKAYDILNSIKLKLLNFKVEISQIHFLNAIIYYVEFLMNGDTEHSEIMEYIKIFFSEDLYNKIDLMFKDKKNILHNVYANSLFNLDNINELKKEIAEINQLGKVLYTSRKFSGINQMDLKSIFN